MKTITLPVSGYVVELRESILYDEYEGIENYYTNNVRVSVSGNGAQAAELNGKLVQEGKQKMIQIFLHSCKDGNTEISTVGLMTKLDVVDGKIIENEVADIFDAIKKKLETTTKK